MTFVFVFSILNVCRAKRFRLLFNPYFLIRSRDLAVIHEVQPVKPVCAVLVSRDIILDEALNALEQTFGSIDEKSVPYDFNFTSYYKKEMGSLVDKILEKIG